MCDDIKCRRHVCICRFEDVLSVIYRNRTIIIRVGSAIVLSRSNGVRTSIIRRYLLSIVRAIDIDMYFVQQKAVKYGVSDTENAIKIVNANISNIVSLARVTLGCTSEQGENSVVLSSHSYMLVCPTPPTKIDNSSFPILLFKREVINVDEANSILIFLFREGGLGLLIGGQG